MGESEEDRVVYYITSYIVPVEIEQLVVLPPP